MIFRLLRGGSFYDVARDLRSSYRFRSQPVLRFRFDGFRLVIRREP